MIDRNRGGRVTIGGLGPAGPELMTAETLDAIKTAPMMRLRTSIHPAAEVVDAPSYDYLYESHDTFEAVYSAIVNDLIELSRTNDVLYLVPGAPTVAERTVELLIADGSVDIQLLAAMSFLDLTWSRLNIDPVEQGVSLVDGHSFSARLPTLSGSVLVSQCHNNNVMSEVKLAFGSREPISATVLHHLGLDDEAIVVVPWAQIDQTVEADHLTSLFISSLPASPASAIADFSALVARLRRDCAWDRDQTHLSLVRYLLEETYEVVEAIESSADDAAVAGELGDLLFQVVLHAVIGDESAAFDLVDIVESISAKLVHRHPELFSVDAKLADLSDREATAQWERLKAAEVGDASQFSNVPELPPLAKAAKLMDKGDAIGFRWPDIALAQAKVDEELGEFRAEADIDGQERELGDVFLALVGVARAMGIDPDTSLRRSNRTFIARLRHLEAAARESGEDLTSFGVEDLMVRWRAAKSAVSAAEAAFQTD